MKINFEHLLVDAEDKTILENGFPASIKTVLKRAILADTQPNGQPIQADEKVKRFELFLKLREADSNTDFSLDEVALLESAILVFPVLIAGQLNYLLHNKTVK